MQNARDGRDKPDTRSLLQEGKVELVEGCSPEMMAHRLRLGNAAGWVYILQEGPSGPLKMGWAKDPEKRLKTHQTSQPRPLRLKGVIPGDRKLEAELHRIFAGSRVKGEWFRADTAGRDMTTMIKQYGFVASRARKSRNMSGANPPYQYYSFD